MHVVRKLPTVHSVRTTPILVHITPVKRGYCCYVLSSIECRSCPAQELSSLP